MKKVYIIWEELFDAFGNCCGREIVSVHETEVGAVMEEKSLSKYLDQSPFYSTLWFVKP